MANLSPCERVSHVTRAPRAGTGRFCYYARQGGAATCYGHCQIESVILLYERLTWMSDAHTYERGSGPGIINALFYIERILFCTV